MEGQAASSNQQVYYYWAVVVAVCSLATVLSDAKGRGAAESSMVRGGVCGKVYEIHGGQKVMENCVALRAQGAQLAWTLHPAAASAGEGQETLAGLEVIFAETAPSASGWVGWGLNLGPTPSMVGTQAFIAFQASNGSCLLTYNVTQATAMGAPLACSPLSLRVNDMAVHIHSNSSSMVMWVSLLLPSNHSSALHHVWNRGSSVANFQPGPHGGSADDLSAFATLDMASGRSSTSAAPAPASPSHLLRNRHGILNAVGWGIIVPCGVLAARYLRPFANPAWFYLHISLQVAGYGVGVAGWATGLKLGNESVGIVYRKHRILGIVLFAVATLQLVGAILLRPKKGSKLRTVWNFYHLTLGAMVLVLAILNIFYGFDILAPPREWRWAYIWILIALALMAFFLEAYKCTGTFLLTSRRTSKMQGVQVGGALSSGSGLA